jgi:hypothetical protein
MAVQEKNVKNTEGKKQINDRTIFFKYFKYIFWILKFLAFFPKVDDRFRILDIYKCPFSESAWGLSKMARFWLHKNSYGLMPKKK